MATKIESDFPSSPVNNDSDENGEEEDIKPSANDVSDILKRLQSSGAVIKKPKQEYRCYTCEEDFISWEELEQHLIQHVSLPSVLLNKLSDDEDAPLSGDDWSEDDEPLPPKTIPQKTPQKVDISQILNKTGISIKKPNENSSDSAINKLAGLGFTIKKNTTPIKTEKPESNEDVMQKLGQLGGIKLKLKSDGNNSNTFKVVNGLKDFKASDDEDEDIENDGKEDDGEFDDEHDKSQENSGGDQDSEDEHNSSNHKNTESDDSDKTVLIQKEHGTPVKNISLKTVSQKQEANKTPQKIPVSQSPLKQVVKVNPRPAVKQTPKRVTPIAVREASKAEDQPKPAQDQETVTSTTERRQSQNTNMDNIVVKQEVDTGDTQSSNIPLFTDKIKTERSSPTPNDSTGPELTTIKTEPDATPSQAENNALSCTIPLLRVAKQEDTGVTVIEINGDSNDEDDDCCVVSATPAPDVKPIIPKTENPPTAYVSPVSFSQPSYSSAPVLASRTFSTEKQHNFNWNAPDSKPPLDMLEKTTDDIFESLLSSTTKKENNLSSMSDSEYISLDTLGPRHTCDVCKLRFTDVMLLEEHKRSSGHSFSLVAPSSTTMLPYSQSNSILQSLLPVKQIAEQVGKLSCISGSGPGFTHQQNVMINIQAYPGAGGVSSPYNAFPAGQNMHPSFPQNSGPQNMYNAPGQPMSGQYPDQNYMSSGYGQQFQQPMSKAGYPGAMPQNVYSTTPTSLPYSTSSPLHGLQQTVYGQSMSSPHPQMGQMGPPSMSPAGTYVPVSSPGGSMKPPPSPNIRIQNVQTFAPGQAATPPGQPVAPGAPGQVGAQMASPSTIRMATNVNVGGLRPRMPHMRSGRPSIRPGLQMQGQIRGARPRMPMKRPAAPASGPNQKRRTDMLLPGKHDNEDCHVMSMQKQREGLPMIHSVQGAKDKLNLGSQISITKKTVNKEANAMANVLASRGISIKQKQKSRSPSPERPLPHIPNLGAGVSIKHTSKSSNFSIPESTVGGSMLSCKICNKMFMNQNSLAVHISNAHPHSKVPMFKCDECPASYPKSLQLQHHKRVFHNVSGPNRELGLPVVDISREDSIKKLSNLGIYSFIPLANREQADGCFGIPVLSVHNMQSGMMAHSLKALGADGLLSLGPMKPLPDT